MRHSRDRRRAAATLYVVIAVTLLVTAWGSMSVVLLVLGIAFLALAAWALKSYPIDRDW